MSKNVCVLCTFVGAIRTQKNIYKKREKNCGEHIFIVVSKIQAFSHPTFTFKRLHSEHAVPIEQKSNAEKNIKAHDDKKKKNFFCSQTNENKINQR